MTIAPPLTEAAFMDQVTQYAELCGWEWVHCRAGRTVDSWRTPMSGTMAKGWPDLVLCRGNRLLFVELKRDGARLTGAQARVREVLYRVATFDVWRPADWDRLERMLR